MKVEVGSVTLISPGSEIIILNDSTLDIQSIVFFIANSSTDASAGFSDGTTQFSGNATYGEKSTTKPIIHYRNISGVKTKTFEATVPSGGLDTGEFSLTVSTCTQNTTLRFVAYGN